jgi:hypothetical protein
MAEKEYAEYLADQSFARIHQFQCRLVELSVNLENAVAAGTYFVWVFDEAIDSGNGVGANRTPRLPPIKINPGEARGWASPTKWSLMRRGLSVGISTSDDTYSDAGVQFGVYYHIVEERSC